MPPPFKESLKESVASKKFWFAVLAIGAGFVFAILAAWKLTEMKSMYDGFTGLVEFVVAAYLSGNIANKWVVGKHMGDNKKKKKKGDADPADPTPQDPPKP